MSVFTRAELSAILEARHGQAELKGNVPWLEFRIRMTPESLEAVMDGHFVGRDGTKARLEAIEIDGDLATPILTICQ